MIFEHDLLSLLFLSSSMASIIVSATCCESTKAFINVEIHGHMKSHHDPHINNYFQNHRRASVVLMFFLPIDCLVCGNSCHLTVIVVTVDFQVFETAKDGYWRVWMSHHDLQQHTGSKVLRLWIIRVILVTVSGLLSRAVLNRQKLVACYFWTQQNKVHITFSCCCSS